jgi:uncharacterized PurR-regulated membrane protein YhhQ (DUF165 family)
MKKILAFAVYCLSIPAANWMISNIGTQSFPDGPHTIPVGFGYSAPSGVLLIGFALFARDIIQRVSGRKIALIAIGLGSLISYLLADKNIATASVIAFAIGELVDFCVYTPLHKKRIVTAVVVSGIIGGVVDSLLFLQIAFGSTMFWQGQVIGKAYVSLLAGLLIWIYNRDLSQRRTS